MTSTAHRKAHSCSRNTFDSDPPTDFTSRSTLNFFFRARPRGHHGHLPECPDTFWFPSRKDLRSTSWAMERAQVSAKAFSDFVISQREKAGIVLCISPHLEARLVSSMDLGI